MIKTRWKRFWLYMTNICSWYSSEIWLGISNLVLLQWENLKKFHLQQPPGDMKSRFSVWLDKQMPREIILPVVNASLRHTLYIFIRLCFSPNDVTIFNDLEHFFFHFFFFCNSKSECLSLRVHTLLQQLVIDAHLTEQIDTKGKLWGNPLGQSRLCPVCAPHIR